jgi:predicted Zn-dependent protease
MGLADNFRAMLARGQDSALLRFSLGSALLKEGDAAEAATHLAEAVRQDPGYSAAWKLYGKALEATGDTGAAIDAYERGFEVAEGKGDKQAAREMTVFLKRLRRHSG